MLKLASVHASLASLKASTYEVQYALTVRALRHR